MVPLMVLGGLVLMLLSGYGLYWIISMILKGVFTENLIFLIGGGILLYFIGSLLIVGVIVGFMLFFAGVED